MRRMRFIVYLLIFLTGAVRADAITAGDMFTKALAVGDLATLETLLSSGFNPNLPDSHGQTPLYLALTTNQAGVVELLLRWHADPNGRLKSGRDNGQFAFTPLQFAAQQGDLRMASKLIAAGAELNAVGVAGRSALHFAGGRRLDIMQLLIEKGADVNARDTEGASPLDYAVWSGSLDAVAVLLAHGARLNEPEAVTGATPINEAAFQGHTSVVRYLLQFHPDLVLTDKRGYRPLDNAVRMGRDESAVLLLDAEPTERQTHAFVDQLLGTAIAKDEAFLVESLLKHGAVPNLPLPSGATPLAEAAASGSLKAARILLENKADPNAGGPNGATPLEEAALKGNDGIAKLLLDDGAMVNQLNAGSGTTALYAAASFGKGSTVKLLLDHGADPGLCGRNNKSAYQAAVTNGYTEVALLILRSGGKGCK